MRTEVDTGAVCCGLELGSPALHRVFNGGFCIAELLVLSWLYCSRLLGRAYYACLRTASCHGGVLRLSFDPSLCRLS